MKEKLLSVIITTFERKIQILDRAVLSVKNQTYPYIEIIVIDDNPNDSLLSPEIKKYCNNQGIKYLKQFGNLGACIARNLGVANSYGEYIAFLDDDDEWFPTKVEEQIHYINQGYSLVFCKGLVIDTRNSIYKEKIYGNSVGFISQPHFQDLLIKNRIGTTSQIMVSREKFIQVNGFDSRFQARQDYDFCLQISRHFKIYGVDNILFKHYLHDEQQISQSPKKALQGYLLLFDKYKYDYKRNKDAYINILCKIAKSYRNNNMYLRWMFVFIRAVIVAPSKFDLILEKVTEEKII